MSRRHARRRVLELLFEMDIGKVPPEQILSRLLVVRTAHCAQRTALEEGFVLQEIEGIVAHLCEIDSLIDSFSPQWSLQRMAAADRNVLRIACYELLRREDIPVAVSINEAVVLAKRFGGEKSGKFVNGILGAISRSGEVKKAAQPSPEAGEGGERRLEASGNRHQADSALSL